MGRHRWLGRLLALALLAATVRAGPEDEHDKGPRLDGEAFAIQFPPGTNDGEQERGRLLLDLLEVVRGDLDDALVAAKAMRESTARRQIPKAKRWLVRYFPQAADCRAFLKHYDERLADAPCTQFWIGPEFPRPFMTLFPYEKEHDAIIRDVLVEGAKQVLFERVGVDCVFRGGDRGIPLHKGLLGWFRHSVRPTKGPLAPRWLGSTPADATDRMIARLDAGTFPSIAEMFDAPQEEYDEDGHRVFWASVLLVEFLQVEIEDGANRFYKHLAKQKRAAGAEEGARALAAFRKAYKKEGDLDARLQTYVRERSKTWNIHRFAARDAPRPER